MRLEGPGWWYYQYLLASGALVLEPWERSVCNALLLVLMLMALYTACVFLPAHLRLALAFFCQLTEEQPESTATLMPPA